MSIEVLEAGPVVLRASSAGSCEGFGDPQLRFLSLTLLRSTA